MLKFEINMDRVKGTNPIYRDLPSSELIITVEDIEISTQKITYVEDWRYVNLPKRAKERISELVTSGTLNVYHESNILTSEEVLTYDLDRSISSSGIHVGPLPPDLPVQGTQWYDTSNYIHYTHTGLFWLSDEKILINFSKNNNASSLFLRVGNIEGSSTGYLVPMDAQIRYITALASGGDDTKNFTILASGMEVFSFALTALRYINSNAGLNVPAGTVLQCFCNSGSIVVNPSVDLIISWRK